MSSLSASELATEYSSGLSMADIARQKGISVHKVVYWMDKYKISRRSPSEATYTKRNPNGDPFQVTNIDTQEKTELLALSIGLFLGEGNKRDNHQVRFGNSSDEIIKLFLKFLRQICCVQESKIRASLNIFDDLDYESCQKYWSEITQISEDRFYKPIIRPGKIGTYKNKSKYGTITILVSNMKLLNQIKTWCNNYITMYTK